MSWIFGSLMGSMWMATTNTELSDFIWTDALGGCVMQLWIGPLLGLVIGGTGALVGKIVRNSLVRMRFA